MQDNHPVIEFDMEDHTFFITFHVWNLITEGVSLNSSPMAGMGGRQLARTLPLPSPFALAALALVQLATSAA